MISHELAHSFGAMHDWGLEPTLKRRLDKQGARPSNGCTCTLPDGTKVDGETKKCIMSPIIDSQLSSTWSDCSYADLDFTKEVSSRLAV